MTNNTIPIRFDRVEKRFATVQALHPLSLSIGPGEFLTLLGPSGSGKTTLLNVMAGYLTPDGGRVYIGDQDVTHMPARKRNIGMVFQNYALFPHLSVFENIAYGLRVRRVPQAEIRRRVQDALAMVQLDGLGERSIRQLSGGQQQRVALARAFVIEPSLLLMDEPLGALDRQLRKHVQLEIRRLQHTVRRTTLYVTHDQEEALVMSDRIAVMNKGRIEQVGTPRELYDQPVNAFVASFLGESNLLYGTVTGTAPGRARLAVEGLDGPVEGIAARDLREGEKAACLVRPEAIVLDSDSRPSASAQIEEVVYLGELVALRLRLSNGTEVWCRWLAKDGLPSGDSIRVGWHPDDSRILPL